MIRMNARQFKLRHGGVEQSESPFQSMRDSQQKAAQTRFDYFTGNVIAAHWYSVRPSA